ncbi:E3 SUMO-protein ligase ZBED1-like, partial [Temnothorax nylanderi]|uniref:E3 SUMO-protein ligase ZBED1-like n=1 Tax=Temnothorax nylanderi TaxID=102681 RepID=UPI003A88D24F
MAEKKKKNFFVVEFKDGLQIIPKTWLTSDLKRAKWPNCYVTNKRYDKAVKDMEQSESTWEEHPIVKLFMACPDYATAQTTLKLAKKLSDIPCSETLKKRLYLLYDDVKEKIKLEMSKATSVTCISDFWSLKTQDAYITVVGQFLSDNWEVKSYTLTTEEVEEHHTTININAKLLEILHEFRKIDEKTTIVVTDNAINITNAVKALPNLTVNEGTTCAAHTMQLAISKGLDIKKIVTFYQKAKKMVEHFRHSNIACEALKANQENLKMPVLKLIQSVPTRWNSTFDMLERLLKNRRPVESVLANRSVTKPKVAQNLEISDYEWHIMENFVNVLKPLQVVTTVLCANNSPFSIVRPIVRSLLENHLNHNLLDDDLLSKFKEVVCQELSTRFDMDWNENSTFTARQIGSFFDPRYKDLCAEEVEAKEAVKVTVRTMLNDRLDSAEDTEKPEKSALDFLFQTQPNRYTAQAQFAR